MTRQQVRLQRGPAQQATGRARSQTESDRLKIGAEGVDLFALDNRQSAAGRFEVLAIVGRI